MSWLPKQKIVVPLDFSEDALAAIDTAADLAAQATGVHVVHVLPELIPLEPGDASWQAADDEARVAQALHTMRGRLAADKYAGMQLKVLVGDAGHSIANYAAEIGAELVVMPSHGRTGLARMLIGSVAERVVRLARCPVLVLRK